MVESTAHSRLRGARRYLGKGGAQAATVFRTIAIGTPSGSAGVVSELVERRDLLTSLPSCLANSIVPARMCELSTDAAVAAGDLVVQPSAWRSSIRPVLVYRLQTNGRGCPACSTLRTEQPPKQDSTHRTRRRQQDNEYMAGRPTVELVAKAAPVAVDMPLTENRSSATSGQHGVLVRSGSRTTGNWCA